MKKGAILINYSRGNIVNINSLKRNLKNNKLLGAAIDVFPKEPLSNKEKFKSELIGLNNIILSPHIGGSTEEAILAMGIAAIDGLDNAKDPLELLQLKD